MFSIHDIQYLIRKIIKGGNLQIINDGFKASKAKITDYIFGSATPLKKEIICPAGDWTPYLPPEERQSNRRVETMSCTCFGFYNVVETIIFAKYGIRVNYSDRYLSKCAGTTRNGNSMDSVIETARKISGSVLEEKWPFNEDMDWSEYFADIPKAVLDDGRLWINEWEIGYENVPQNKSLMKQALTYSPLYVAGYAWYSEGGVYKSYGRANHAFMVHKIDTAFDSYEPFVKNLDTNYKFGAIKALYVNKLKAQDIEIKKLLLRGFKYIMRVEDKGEIYKITNGILEETKIEELIESLKIDGDKGADFNKVVSDVVKAMFANKLLVPVSEELFTKLK